MKSEKERRRAAVALWTTWLAFLGAAIVLIAVHRASSDVGIYEFWLESTVGSSVFALPGVLLALRRPENSIGWIFLGTAALSSIQFATGEYAVYALRVRPGELPAAEFAALISNSVQTGVVLAFLLLLLLFPTGRPLTPRWGVAAYLMLAGFGGVLAGSAISSEPLESLPFVVSPLAAAGMQGTAETLRAIGGGLLLAGGIASLVSLLLRYRRSRGEQRQQLKLFAYAAVVGVIIIFVTPEQFGSVVWTLAPSSLPLAAGVAILKYRLYDLDRLISRTLVYGILTAFLAGVYVSVVVSLQAVLGERFGADPLVVAATTLGVAALFRPARARIQSIIDRRFNRRKFDAQQTLDAFSARLRDEIDLNELSTDLLMVVRDTVQPIHASLWLRPAPSTRTQQA